jgi:trans-aconitate methyltransferase
VAASASSSRGCYVADLWAQGTREHDVSQNIAKLLQHIEDQPPFTILDFGCGPGRDLKSVFANASLR